MQGMLLLAIYLSASQPPTSLTGRPGVMHSLHWAKSNTQRKILNTILSLNNLGIIYWNLIKMF